MNKFTSIVKNRDFLRLYKKGSYYVGRYMVVYIQKNTTGTNRLGITVSKKVGNSVKRNRIRRLIKENFRNYVNYLDGSIDIVIVSRSSEEMPDYFMIKREMKFLLKKLKVLDVKKWDTQEKS